MYFLADSTDKDGVVDPQNGTMKGCDFGFVIL